MTGRLLALLFHGCRLANGVEMLQTLAAVGLCATGANFRAVSSAGRSLVLPKADAAESRKPR